MVNDARSKCFSVESDPIFQTCQQTNRDLKEENHKLNKEIEAVMSAKVHLEDSNDSMKEKLVEMTQKLKDCECDLKIQKILAENEARFLKMEKLLLQAGSSQF